MPTAQESTDALPEALTGFDSSSDPAANPIAARRALVAAIYAGVVALLVVNTLPALVNVISGGLKWDDRALGLFASADVAGITLGSVLGVPLVRRLSLRGVVLWSVATLIAADVACGMADQRWFIVGCRFLGGTASGLVLTACYAVYSSSRPQRNFALFSIGQMVSSFLGVTAIPILSASLGWRSSFYLLAAFTAVAISLASSLPRDSFAKPTPPEERSEPAHSSLAVWRAVAGVLAYIIGEGAVWTFMERIGLDSGLSEHNVNVAVSACTLAGVLGAFVMLFPSKRLGTLLPLTITALMSVLGVALMRTSSPALFVAALSAFTFSWLSFSTVQFAVIAEADTAGVATISMSAAWYAGFAIGPYLAGALVAQYGFRPVQFLGISGVLLALLSLLPLHRTRGSGVRVLQ